MKTIWTIEPYRYAKHSIAVRIESHEGFKTKHHASVEALHGRYCGRANGYILPQSKEQQIRAAFAKLDCPHPPSRYFSWFAKDTLCVACCDCGTVLAGGAE